MVKQNVGTFSKMLTNIITKMLMKPFEQMLDSTIFVYTNVGATFQKNVSSTVYEKC
jgi:type IV secretory pathway VirB9-like protein